MSRAGAPFRGLTWDHPRGYNALAAAAEIAASPLISWEKQPLEGFESEPIGALAARYDLIVMDHPHLGEAVAQDCLIPLEALFASEEIADWARATVGAAMASYEWRNRHWALPLDVAAQVSAGLCDRLDVWPDSWDDVVHLSERVPVALSLAGPHATLSLFAVSLALGREPGGPDLLDTPTFLASLRILRRLHARAPAGSERLNPISLLDALQGDRGIAFVPLVFGYVNYASARGAQRVVFGAAPAGPGGRRGSVLGGTGIALTRRAKPDAALIAHLRWLISHPAQCAFIPDHDGQPAARAAWCDPGLNDRAGDFYRRTLATTEGAWLRPRFDGFIAFQGAASAIVRHALVDGGRGEHALDALRRAWQAARSGPGIGATVAEKA